MSLTPPLAVVGCDFRIASSRARSSLVMAPEEIQKLADSLKTGGWAEGLVVLDTCNRNEWIVASDNPTWAGELLQSRMRERLPRDLRDRIAPYVRVGDGAATHLFRVAVGQESLVVGERQISGQLFKALALAHKNGHSARVFHDVESTLGRLVRIAQKRGHLHTSSVGVHSLALSWLRTHHKPTSGRVAVVGMGAIGRKIMANLEADPNWQPVPVNRTVPPGSLYRPLEDLAEILPTVDAAIFCTAAPSPVFDPCDLEPDASPVLIDLGIPEQIARPADRDRDPATGIDELVCWHQSRAAVAPGADADPMDALVERALQELHRALQHPPLAPVLEQVRSRSRALVRTELHALLKQKLTTVTPVERGQIEADLASLLGTYTNDVLQTIRQGAPDGEWVEP